jgi:hypothetical protein
MGERRDGEDCDEFRFPVLLQARHARKDTPTRPERISGKALTAGVSSGR